MTIIRVCFYTSRGIVSSFSVFLNEQQLQFDSIYFGWIKPNGNGVGFTAYFGQMCVTAIFGGNYNQ